MIFFANIAGFIYTYRRAFIVGVAGLVLLFLVFFLYRACNKPKLELSPQEKQEIQNAIADRDEKKLKEKLVELETKEKVVDENVANAQAEKWAAVQESKEKWANANISELQAEFDRRMRE